MYFIKKFGFTSTKAIFVVEDIKQKCKEIYRLMTQK